MRTLLSLACLFFVTAVSAADYSDQTNPFAFRPVIAATTGEVDFEYGEDRETWTSFSAAADFEKYPVELEFRYSTADIEAQVLGAPTEGTWGNWGVGAKLDLSWNCRATCLYLMAGYNYGEYEATVELDGETVDESLDANYIHVGVGFRYQFADNLRALVEWQQYNIGKQDHKDFGEIDFGHARVWQAGLAFTF